MTASKKDRLVNQLVADCKKILKEDFSEAKVKQSFIILKEAKSRGLLGPDRRRDCVLAETVNIANNLLRIHKFSKEELVAELQKPDTLYVYIGLVATNCIFAA
ncbi:MAG: hypothetical protein WCD53_12260 [Microcoleus sp.]